MTLLIDCPFQKLNSRLMEKICQSKKQNQRVTVLLVVLDQDAVEVVVEAVAVWVAVGVVVVKAMVVVSRVVTTRVDTIKVVITRDIMLETKLAMVEIKVDTIKVLAEMLVMANNNNIQQPIP